MTVFRFRPGEVVALSHSLKEPYQFFYPLRSSSVIERRTFELRHSEDRKANYAIRLLRVPVGQEENYIAELADDKNTISASLNYVCALSGQPELAHRAKIRPPTIVLLCRDQNSEPAEVELGSYERLLQAVGSLPRNICIACAVDVQKKHAKSVLEAMQRGYSGKSSCAFLCITANSNRSSVGDLFDVSTRIGLIGELLTVYRIVCVNFSFDFAQMNCEYADFFSASRETPDMGGAPFFDEILDRFLTLSSENTSSHTSAPAIFAGAGNRLSSGSAPRIRLAFPASRHDVIAVTYSRAYAPERSGPFGKLREFLKSRTSPSRADQIFRDTKPQAGYYDGIVSPGSQCDCPSSSSVKPCFALAESEFSTGSNRGSSYACAWLAGWYASVAQDAGNHSLRSDLGRLTTLIKSSKLHRMEVSRENSDIRYLPTYVYQVNPLTPPIASGVEDGGYFSRILKGRGGADEINVAVFGSCAYVDAFLWCYDLDFGLSYSDLSDLIGDLDIITLGPTGASTGKKLGSEVARRAKLNTNRLHSLHLSEFPRGRERCAQTPVTRIVATSAGWIDVLDGLNDLRRGQIRFCLSTDAQIWDASGASFDHQSCLGICILRWLSSVLVLRSTARRLQLPMPTACPGSLDIVQRLLERDGDLDNGLRSLFPPGRSPQIHRQTQRAQELLAKLGELSGEESHLAELLDRLRKKYEA